MSTEGEDLSVWLGSAHEHLVQLGRLEDFYAARDAYYALPAVAGRGGEPADHAEEDAAVLTAMVQQLLDELDLAALGAAHVQARADLHAAVVGATLAGLSEAQAARDGRLDRMTVRRLLGKR